MMLLQRWSCRCGIRGDAADAVAALGRPTIVASEVMQLMLLQRSSWSRSRSAQDRMCPRVTTASTSAGLWHQAQY